MSDKEDKGTTINLSMTYPKRLEDEEIMTEAVQAELIRGGVPAEIRETLDNEDTPIHVTFTLNFSKELNLEPIVFEMTWAQSKSLCSLGN